MLLIYCLAVVSVTIICSDYSFGKSVQLVNSNQFHYVASGSYLAMMFSKVNTSDNKYQQAKVNASLNITIDPLNNSSVYSFDFMTFPSESPYAAEQLRCYQNSIALNISYLSNCSLPDCQLCDNNNDCIKRCFNQQYGNISCCCSNCTSSSYELLLINNIEFSLLNSSQLVMVIDNSQFLGSDSQVIPPLGLLVEYQLSIDMNQEYEAVLYLVLGLFSLFIIIMVATCIWLYKKIDRTNK
jgi:hypothetical protein